ncbi:hypothetical protein JAAARDRAFT_66972, partial [Jaapia argillacea MUCL 33604]
MFSRQTRADIRSLSLVLASRGQGWETARVLYSVVMSLSNVSPFTPLALARSPPRVSPKKTCSQAPLQPLVLAASQWQRRGLRRTLMGRQSSSADPMSFLHRQPILTPSFYGIGMRLGRTRSVPITITVIAHP